MNIEIKTYTPSELHEFINSEDFKHLNDYPITRHRALSHINNPRGNANDKILYIAFENSQVIAYRLIMVDSIIVENKVEKIGWFSCVWVHPQKRGTGIAKQLVEMALKDWNNNIVFQGPVNASKNLYTRTNLFNEVYITGLRAYTRFDFNEVISTRKPALQPLSFLFKTVDSFLNLFVDAFSILKSTPVISTNYTFVEEIDDEICSFIQNHHSNNLFKRSKTELNWMLKYPWILVSDKMDNVSANYYFSSIAKNFKYVNIQLVDSNQLITGFLMLQIRNKHLTVQMACFESSQIKNVVYLIYKVIKDNKTNSFSVYNEEIVNYMTSNSNPFLFKKTLKRGFYYSKKFEHYFKKNPQLSFEAGDGDMIFT